MLSPLARQFQSAIDRYGKKFDESQVNRDEDGKFAENDSDKPIDDIESKLKEFDDHWFNDEYGWAVSIKGKKVFTFSRYGGNWWIEEVEEWESRKKAEKDYQNEIKAIIREERIEEYRRLIADAVERYAKKSKPAKGQKGFDFDESKFNRDEKGQFAEKESAGDEKPETKPPGNEKPVRFEVGKNLSESEKKKVLDSISDAYKQAGLSRDEIKGYNHDGDPIYGWPYRPDVFETSDITGAKIRHYVTLPDGRKAHPTELFPNMTQANVDQALAEQAFAKKMEKRESERKLQRVSDGEKNRANYLYQSTNRPLEGSYFAQHDDGRIVRVDGNDEKDVKFFESVGFQKVENKPAPAAADDSGFSLKRETGKGKKKATFDDTGKGKQGGLFDTGKKDIKGQELLFDDHYDPKAAAEDAEKRAENKGKSTLDVPEKPATADKPTSGTKSPAFKKWFGDSKVVDENGEPLVVYHGTGRDFDVFDSEKIGEGDPGFHGEGFYFSGDSEYASAYAPLATGGGNVKPVYLSMQNPFVAPTAATHGDDWRDEYRGALEEMGVKDFGNRKEQSEKIKAAGYDGVIVQRKDDQGNLYPFEIVAFSPNQIKSATGNRGTFDPDDDRITYSRLTAAFDRAFYARMSEPARYACNWITLSTKDKSGEKTGGAKVCIGDDGKIEKGPKGLRKKKIGSIVGPQNQVDDAIRTGAKRFGVKKSDLKAAVEDVLTERRELIKERENMKQMARKWAGLNPSDVERIKNAHKDYTSIKGFDDVADELANNFPELGLDPQYPSESLWELVQEPRQNLPKKHDPEIVEEAAERLLASGYKRGQSMPEIDDDDDYVPFSRLRQAFDREFYRRMART